MKNALALREAAGRGLGLISLPLAVAGQWLLDDPRANPAGWWLLGLGALAFATGLGRAEPKRAAFEPAVEPTERSRWDLWLALLGAAASLSSYACFGGNRLTWYGALLWQAGLWAFVAGELGSRRVAGALRGAAGRLRGLALRVTPTRLLLLGVVGVGAALRLWEIAGLPAEPGVDLPLILLAVRQVLDGRWPVFSTLHPGRETLYIYLAAGYVKLFGLSFPALRTLSALVGTATIPVAYLAGRRLFGRRVGLLAACWLAVSRWHVILSRTGLRFILMPLFSLALVLALEAALRRRRLWDWVLVGLVLGWGFHTYNAWLIMPVLVVGALALDQMATGRRSTRDWFLLALALDVALLLFIPLARFGHDDPVMFSLRVASRLSTGEAPAAAELLRTLWGNIAHTAGMFNRVGDAVAHINVPLKREMGWISGALLIPGLAYLLWNWRRHSLVLVGLVVTCLPTTLALAFPNEVPNAGRASGAIGLACLIAAVALARWTRLADGWQPAGRTGKTVRLVLQGLLALAMLAGPAADARETRDDYFERYRFVLAGGNYPISTRIAEAIQNFGGSGDVYLKAYPHFYDGNALRTQLWLAGVKWDQELIEIPDGGLGHKGDSRALVVIVNPADSETQQALLAAYPQAAILTSYDNHGVPAFLSFVAAP